MFCPHRTHLFGVTDKFKFDYYENDVYDNEGNVIRHRGEPIYDENGNESKITTS